LAIAKKRGNMVKGQVPSAAPLAARIRGGALILLRDLAEPSGKDDPRSMAETIDARSTPAGTSAPKPLRLYRGLTRPHDPRRVEHARTSGTNFTDCPFTALRYAARPRGVVLVLDVPPGWPRVSEELWLVSGPKRFMIWGAFDDFIVAELAAKELRAHVRRKGVVATSDGEKAAVLRRAIMEHLRERQVSSRVVTHP
jgi:hypothetical protein